MNLKTCGKCYSESQGSVEHPNHNVKNTIFTWLEENNSKQWSKGFGFCQFQKKKNSSLHRGIQQTLFEVMFACKAQIDLISSMLLNNILNSSVSEENLEPCT